MSNRCGGNYPQELLDRKQWVNWRLIPDKDGGKDKKMPYNPITGKGAQSNNPATWTDYATAADALERYGFTGLGFMFSKEDDIVGVDIDHLTRAKPFLGHEQSLPGEPPTWVSPQRRRSYILRGAIRCRQQAYQDQYGDIRAY